MIRIFYFINLATVVLTSGQNLPMSVVGRKLMNGLDFLDCFELVWSRSFIIVNSSIITKEATYVRI